MSEHGQRIYCGNCGHEVPEGPDGQFLGFSRFTCATCSEQVTGPISEPGRRVAWGVALASLALADVLLLMRLEAFGLFGLGLSMAALTFVIVNRRIIGRHRTRGRNNWLVELARRADRFTQSPHTTGG